MLRSKWNLVHLFLLLLVLAIVPTSVANAQSGTEIFLPQVQTDEGLVTVAGGKMPVEEFEKEVESQKAQFVAKYGQPFFEKNVGNFDGEDKGPYPSKDNDEEYVWFVALNSVGCRDTAPQGLRLYLDGEVFEIITPNVGCAWFSGLTNPLQAAQLIISSYNNGEGRESITDSYVAAFKMDKPEVCPAGYQEIKFDSPFGSGTIGPITVEVTEVKDGEPVKFRWEANGVEVIWVQVKGGPTSNTVYYDPPATSGEGLMAPDGKGISHVVFCFKPLPPPPPPVCEETVAVYGEWSGWQPVPGNPAKEFRTRTVSHVDVNDNNVVCDTEQEKETRNKVCYSTTPVYGPWSEWQPVPDDNTKEFRTRVVSHVDVNDNSVVCDTDEELEMRTLPPPPPVYEPCVSAVFDPELPPGGIGPEGFDTTIVITPERKEEYIIVSSLSGPITSTTHIVPRKVFGNENFTIFVADPDVKGNTPCILGGVPTGLDPIEQPNQPTLRYRWFIPYAGKDD